MIGGTEETRRAQNIWGQPVRDTYVHFLAPKRQLLDLVSSYTSIFRHGHSVGLYQARSQGLSPLPLLSTA